MTETMKPDVAEALRKFREDTVHRHEPRDTVARPKHDQFVNAGMNRKARRAFMSGSKHRG